MRLAEVAARVVLAAILLLCIQYFNSARHQVDLERPRLRSAYEIARRIDERSVHSWGKRAPVKRLIQSSQRSGPLEWLFGLAWTCSHYSPRLTLKHSDSVAEDYPILYHGFQIPSTPREDTKSRIL